MADVEALQKMALKLRRLVIRMTTEAGSGHPTSCMSCAEIVSALFFHEMRWDPNEPSARNVDTFVLSKGHAAPILWAVLSEADAINEDPMTLRRIDSSLEGHPTPANRWVRVATGSLGQGLAAANGIALANRLDGSEARVYCLLGDGECSEGSVWEAAQFASLHGLSNLVAIVDVNGLGQTGPTPYRHHAAVFARRFEAFGWRAIEIDGHDMHAVLAALEAAKAAGPTAIVARTVKGKGVAFLESAPDKHGVPLKQGEMDKALQELGEVDIHIKVAPRHVGPSVPLRPAATGQITPAYKIGDQVATRDAFGKALQALGGIMPDIVVVDGDVANSTRTEFFAQAFPDRFFQSYIAEQNMLGTALGLAVSDKVAFAATFAAFFTRAYDFIRMAAYSRPQHLVLCGSHAGVSIGEDGPSQMGLEDLAMMRPIFGSTILYPCDAVSAERLTELAARIGGIVYIRTTRGKTPVIYDAGTDGFPLGGSKLLRSSPADEFTVVAAGITVHEALAAYDSLKGKEITIRVIDAYSVKPLDVNRLHQAARETKGIITVEDHGIEGGLGDAVAVAVGTLAPVYRLGITEMPRSGTPEELLDHYGISRRAIEQQIMNIKT